MLEQQASENGWMIVPTAVGLTWIRSDAVVAVIDQGNKSIIHLSSGDQVYANLHHAIVMDAVLGPVPLEWRNGLEPITPGPAQEGPVTRELAGVDE